MSRWQPHCGDVACDGSCADFACRPPAARDYVLPPLVMERWDYSTNGNHGSVGIRIGKPEVAAVRRYTGNNSITGMVKGEVEFGRELVCNEVADEFMLWLVAELHGLHQDGLRKLAELAPKVAESEVRIVHVPRPVPNNRWRAAWLALWGRL